MSAINYSKWDALELSDDSDIEVHPNVDKRSFIRAKQTQIHQQRAQRRHEIETLKYERIVNDGLLERIDALLSALKKHEDSSRNPDELVFQALIESAGDPARDVPPKPPIGVYEHEKEQPRYSKLMGSLVDQVKKEIEEAQPANRYAAYIDGVKGHLKKVQNLQQELLAKLAQLEKEETSKITSESIHTGFDSFSINKAKEEASKAAATATKSQAKETVEVLNPGALQRNNLPRQDTGLSSGAEADIEDGGPDEADDSDIQPTPLGKAFAKIKMGDYRACLQFISENPGVVAERETDGLLVEAFNAQMDGKEAYARNCVHQGLLLQYCRQLGRDGIGLFFKRITTKDHQASKVFLDDVNSTYGRIKARSTELQKEKADPAGVEQIQLHAVDPNTQIHIVVPQPNSDDPTEKAAREIFERFPPGLQRALESASLDKVNDVLGKMSVEEAEEVVEQLGQGGMLSLEEGVIDATTEEGQAKLKQLEDEGKQRKLEELPEEDEGPGPAEE
ncbi:putative hsp90 co-chaperone cdc37 [Phaeomoniella chlamydospora]|uniref:Hsp90 chaperone protein kinase-targeting subunit n=1 Tax=Phaeomoniella chlamydospora TaxID=158046 RepID=A0A0G2F3A9_PHACM|nr:putative hsp90 co-chaperone cdc37 [Phaeomoniella chlamydospora]